MAALPEPATPRACGCGPGAGYFFSSSRSSSVSSFSLSKMFISDFRPIESSLGRPAELSLWASISDGAADETPSRIECCSFASALLFFVCLLLSFLNLQCVLQLRLTRSAVSAFTSPNTCGCR